MHYFGNSFKSVFKAVAECDGLGVEVADMIDERSICLFAESLYLGIKKASIKLALESCE